MTVLTTYARVVVDDPDLALPEFEHVHGRPADLRFRFEGSEPAAVGDVLLIASAPADRERLRRMIGPLVVDDVDAVVAGLVARGARVRGGFTSPTGCGAYVERPDGTVVDHVRWTPETVERVLG